LTRNVWSTSRLLSLLLSILSLSAYGAGLEGSDNFGSCEAERSYLKQIDNQLDRKRPLPDYSCFITIEEFPSSDPLIVDVRASRLFEKSRIPGSISLSREELLRTESLKPRQLVLVDQGFSRFDQAVTCEKANRHGFENFKILTDGVSGWNAAGRSLLGLSQHFDELHHISVKDLISESYRGSVSILAPRQLVAKVQNLFPYSSVIGFDAAGLTESEIISALSEHSNGGKSPLVVIQANDHSRNQASQLRSVYIMDGTVRDIEAYARDHSILNAKREEIPQRFKCQG